MSQAKISRNAPCPCGSGLKYKRCCLEDGTRLQALAALASLPILFPLMRPGGSDFEAWVDEAIASNPALAPIPASTIDEGLALLDEAEGRQILELAELSSPTLWDRLRRELGRDEEVHGAVLAGAVYAALGEPRSLERELLSLLEETSASGDHPLDPLALAVDATALWSVAEATAVEDAIAAIPIHLDDDAYERRWKATIAQIARSRWTDRHARRLETLVTRVEAQLPLFGFPIASGALARACALFWAEHASAEHLASMLLSDTLEPWWSDELEVAA